MSRYGRLCGCFLSLSLLACGADSAAKQPTQAIATVDVTSAANTITVAGGVSDLALYRAPQAAELKLWTTGPGMQVLSSEGEALLPSLAPAFQNPRFIDVQGDAIWLASHNQLLSVDAKSYALGEVISMADTQVSAIEVAYQGTVFVADAAANRIVSVTGGKTATLTEGENLGHPNALLLNGGSLIIGSDSGVQSFNIKSGEAKVLAGDLGKVVALAHDHLGYFIAATATGEIRQVKSDGSSELLHTSKQALTGIAFDDRTRTLYLADGAHIEVLDYLQLTGEDQKLWAGRDERLMRAFGKNGMTLAGGEYWPSHGTTNVSYPDDILWGFYPSPDEVIEGSAAAVAPPAAATECAEKSYRALQAFFDSNPPAFHRAAEATGASKQFYLWVNDYSDAAKEFPHEQRMNKFWYWERKPAVLGRVPGFWKWETTLLQDGTCLWPQGDQIEQYLSEKLAPAKE
jgi:hypothetical protein